MSKYQEFSLSPPGDGVFRIHYSDTPSFTPQSLLKTLVGPGDFFLNTCIGAYGAWYLNRHRVWIPIYDDIRASHPGFGVLSLILTLDGPSWASTDQIHVVCGGVNVVCGVNGTILGFTASNQFKVVSNELRTVTFRLQSNILIVCLGFWLESHRAVAWQPRSKQGSFRKRLRHGIVNDGS
jgi:hypothetical protein